MITVRKYTHNDIEDAAAIWNSVVKDGLAFPQEDILSNNQAHEFFSEQSYTGVAETDGEIVGLYILHPNNVGRCGHICNASYAVKKGLRGKDIGECLVKDCMEQAKKLDFSILQFNAVVASNKPALALYKKLGFIQLGTIKGGFRNIDGDFEDIIPHYIAL